MPKRRGQMPELNHHRTLPGNFPRCNLPKWSHWQVSEPSPEVRRGMREMTTPPPEVIKAARSGEARGELLNDHGLRDFRCGGRPAQGLAGVGLRFDEVFIVL